MERLTTDGANCNSAITALEGDTCFTYCEEHCCEYGNCEGCEIQKAINRLAAYERTGLEPEEIAALFHRTEH